MKVLITGATGLIGSTLLEQLYLSGFSDIRILTRNKFITKKSIMLSVKIYEWNIDKNFIEDGALNDIDVVLHLAGENISDGRWSLEKKKKILNSRIHSTSLLIKEIKKLNKPPEKFISSSAIGIYGNRGEEFIDETSSQGAGFLSDICKEWENIVLNHDIQGMKSYCLRTGIVLSSKGGVLPKMLLPFKLGIGGKISSGDQYMSWIHIDDLIQQFIFLIKNECKYQIYNGVSPRPVSNYIFTKILGKVLNRPTLMSVPQFVLKLVIGEMAELLTGGQKVIPTRFVEEGYQYKYKSLQNAIKDLLKYEINNEKVLARYQWINRPNDEVFNFFSNENNLEKITPKSLNFRVIRKSTSEIQQGTLIDFQLNFHGLPLKWKSKINSFVKHRSFIDEQVIGPYEKWYHYHDFISIKGGTLIKDKIVYKLPLGGLGNMFAGSLIRKDLTKILNHRKNVINDIFQIKKEEE